MANSQPTHARLRIDRPLVLGLALTFLASMGTGSITLGIFFLTESALGYGRTENYALATALGLIYIVGAAGIGPALQRIFTKYLSTRTVGLIVLVIIGLTSPLPAVLSDAEGAPPAWSIWLVVGVFALATGCLWPIVEAYISGGRREANLRSATGLFNIVWACSVVLAMWLIAPYAEQRPMMVLFWVGLAHILSAGVLIPLPAHPPRHLDDHPHEVDARYEPLLRVTRVLLPVSYLFISSLGPTIPAVLGMLGVGLTWKAPAFSTWLIARLGVFCAMHVWHGWHGRWWVPLLGGGVLIIGFAMTVLSPRLGVLGLPAVFAGLAAFGCGSGLLYVASLYYGMEVGGSNVQDGGRHEAAIGLGYAGGPICGLLAVALVGADSPNLDVAMISIVSVIGALSVVIGLLKAHHFTRTRSRRSIE